MDWINRRRFLTHSLTFAAGVSLVGCSRADEIPPAREKPSDTQGKVAGMKPLIVYYSWSGNTRALARHLASATGGTLFELAPKTPYPSAYHACTEQAKKDIASGFRPALESLPDLSAVDTVLVGSPNWWGTVAPPVSTFLENAALKGKKVALFVTHGGGGLQRCEQDFRKQCKGEPLGRALAVSGSRAARASDEAQRWLKTLELIQ